MHFGHLLGSLAIFGFVGVALRELRVVLLESVRDVLQKDEAKNDMLVFCRVDLTAQFVSGEPHLGLEAKVGPTVGTVGLLRSTSARHLRTS